jgi:5'-deoxynucleotidase YfbR-like HD superfamily hydrolase
MAENGDFELGFLNRLQKLRWIDRCSNTSHIKSYSVAQHSFYMALYGMVFAKIENQRMWEEACGFNSISNHELDYYNVESVVCKALCHDLEESVTGDILFPMHNDHPDFKAILDQIRNKSAEEILFEELPVSVKEDLLYDWKTAKDDSLEGTLISCMDKFEIVMYALTEFELGNMGFAKIYQNAMRILDDKFSIPSVLRLVNEIKEIVKEKYGINL